MNETPTSHVITRSKSKQQAKEDRGEGNGEAALDAPSSTDEDFVDAVTKQEKEETSELMEDEMDIVEEKPDKGKGREMSREVKEWSRLYKRDLILPPEGWPTDGISGVIRVVNGSEYKLDNYENQLMEKGELSPLEKNIYHAGNTNSSFLPPMFRRLDYSTLIENTILMALENDAFNKTQHKRGSFFTGTPLGYLVMHQNSQGDTRVYIPEVLFTNEGVTTTIRTALINETHKKLQHLGTNKTYEDLRASCFWPHMYRDVERFLRTCPECQLNKLLTNKPAGYAHTLPLPT